MDSRVLSDKGVDLQDIDGIDKFYDQISLNEKSHEQHVVRQNETPQSNAS